MQVDGIRIVSLPCLVKNANGKLCFDKEAWDILRRCVDEFKYVKENIGESNAYGWANINAARMALAKLYLNKNAYLGTSGNDGFESALAEVEEVIASGKYSLAPNYKDCFRENIDDCPEIIFAIPGDRTHTV